jgi:outer membrane protein OmpA-like peptidoglycan-associated protein
METNLVDLAKSNFTPGLLQNLGSFIGESPDKTRQLVDDALPNVFAGMAAQSTSETGAARLYGMAKEGTGHDASELMGSLTDTNRAEALGQEGQRVVQSVLGDNAAPISEKIARHVGVNRSVAAKVLALVSPIALATLGKQILSGGINVAGLSSLLSGAGTGARVTTLPERETLRRDWSATEPRPHTSWLPLGLGLLAALIGFLFWAASGKRPARVVAVPQVTPIAPTIQAVPMPVPMPVPGGAAIERLVSGEELTTYLSTTNPVVPKRFIYDGLEFTIGSAALKGEAPASVDNIADALKQHATAEIRLEGYTDNVGDPAANRLLSQQRAETVRTALIARGVSEGRISTAGYGEDRPIASNDSPEGRAQNRRTELVLVKP